MKTSTVSSRLCRTYTDTLHSRKEATDRASFQSDKTSAEVPVSLRTGLCVCGFIPQLKNKKKPWGNQRCTVGGLISLLTRRNKPRTLDRRSFPSRWAALETRRIRRKKKKWALLLLLMNEHYSFTTFGFQFQCYLKIKLLKPFSHKIEEIQWRSKSTQKVSSSWQGENAERFDAEPDNRRVESLPKSKTLTIQRRRRRSSSFVTQTMWI